MGTVKERPGVCRQCGPESRVTNRSRRGGRGTMSLNRYTCHGCDREIGWEYEDKLFGIHIQEYGPMNDPRPEQAMDRAQHEGTTANIMIAASVATGTLIAVSLTGLAGQVAANIAATCGAAGLVIAAASVAILVHRQRRIPAEPDFEELMSKPRPAHSRMTRHRRRPKQTEQRTGE